MGNRRPEFTTLRSVPLSSLPSKPLASTAANLPSRKPVNAAPSVACEYGKCGCTGSSRSRGLALTDRPEIATGSLRRSRNSGPADDLAVHGCMTVAFAAVHIGPPTLVNQLSRNVALGDVLPHGPLPNEAPSAGGPSPFDRWSRRAASAPWPHRRSPSCLPPRPKRAFPLRRQLERSYRSAGHALQRSSAARLPVSSSAR